MLRLSFWIEHGTRGVVFALTGRMGHHISWSSHVHGGGNVADSFCGGLKNVEMIAGFAGRLVSLHLHQLIIIIERFAV